MINLSNYYKLVRASDNRIVDQGNAKNMRRLAKIYTAQFQPHYVALTSRKVGSTFDRVLAEATG